MTHDTPTAAAAAHLQDVQRQVRLLELRQSHHGFAPPPPAGGGMVVGAPHVLGAPGLPVTHPLHAAAAAAAAAAYAGLPYVQPAPAPTMAGQYASQTYGYTFPDYDAPPPYATHGSYIHPSMVSHHHPGAAGGPYAHMQPEVPTVALPAGNHVHVYVSEADAARYGPVHVTYPGDSGYVVVGL